jgi:SAM-dependent methyltransferase
LIVNGDSSNLALDRLKRRLAKERRLKVSAANTEIIVLSEITSYRRLAAERVTGADAVLEIGCSTGETTKVLAETGAQVVAVDKAANLVQVVQSDLQAQPNVRIAQEDGRNLVALAELLPAPTVIFIDIGGDARLDNVALQLRLCLRAFRPRLIVIRSFELAAVTALIGEIETPQAASLLFAEDREFGRDPLSNLLELADSSSVEARIFAARRLSQYDSPAVRERLSAMTADPHPRVREAAVRACQALGIERDRWEIED